ncbi:MAG: T9SS type A sorting domain-containing protein [Bacteroidetes bacterium]|nr:T9SS type A sorting domain-containing protein [Bacteroidota bacterium]
MKFIIASIFLFVPFLLHAQWSWAPITRGDTTGTYFQPMKPYFLDPVHLPSLKVTGDSQSTDGNGSGRVHWKIWAFDQWGGYTFTRHLVQRNSPYERIYDLSDWKTLSFRIKIDSLPFLSAPGKWQIEFKLVARDVPPGTGENRSVYTLPDSVVQKTGVWQKVSVPLEFSFWDLQSGELTGEFDPFLFNGFDLAVVYLPSAGGGIEPLPFAEGEFLIDQIEVSDPAYPSNFRTENLADTTSQPWDHPATWVLSDRTGAPAALAGQLSLSLDNKDIIDGSSSLRVDYQIQTEPDWGAYTEFSHQFRKSPVEICQDLKFYFKNLKPVSVKGQAALALVLWDRPDSYSEEECWYSLVQVNLDDTLNWQQIRYEPYDIKKPWDQLRPGDKGSSLRQGKNNGYPDLSCLTRVGMGIRVFGDEALQTGMNSSVSGSFLIDRFSQAVSSACCEPPFYIDGGITGLYSEGNGTIRINWQDVEEEESNEFYSVFISRYPIHDLSEPGVEKILDRIPEHTGTAVFQVPVPESGQMLRTWVAISINNVASFPEFNSPVDVEGALVPVIGLTPPAGFLPDGNPEEWKDRPFWHLSAEDSTATVLRELNWSSPGRTDLSSQSWLAFSGDSLYGAILVKDDWVEMDGLPGKTPDYPSLAIGLYPYEGKDHYFYRRGIIPDYYLSFLPDQILVNSAVSLIQQGSGYFYGKTDSGYAVEFRISLSDLAKAFPGDFRFKPERGMRIGLDWVILDTDQAGITESGLRWGYTRTADADSRISGWKFTWIGLPDSIETDVGEDNSKSPARFTLEQNYPNPFNPETQIPVILSAPGKLKLEVFDLLGREVAVLFDGTLPAGRHVFPFDGRETAAGLYFVRMVSGSAPQVKKLVLIR